MIARPSDADTATARGAAQYGLARRPLVSSVIAPRAYIMKVKNRSPFTLGSDILLMQVKLPADTEDWQRRPAYIRENNAGVPICENRCGAQGFSASGLPVFDCSNRLQYLVAKGAILRKGQRVKTKVGPDVSESNA